VLQDGRDGRWKTRVTDRQRESGDKVMRLSITCVEANDWREEMKSNQKVSDTEDDELFVTNHLYTI